MKEDENAVSKLFSLFIILLETKGEKLKLYCSNKTV